MRRATGGSGAAETTDPTCAPALPPPPDAERREAIEAVFEDALDVPGERRDAWLAERCAGDDDLRREVDALLAAHEAIDDDFLAAPVRAAARALLDEPTPGRDIGPYRVLRELGRGGMGVVYLAERSDGHFRRRVAVKLLRASPDAEELHRRFRAERQILASLSHPHIAQMLDGGVAEGELPYLVMEHVDGLPITEYCDRNRLGVEGRLRLFRDVCAAVHHAHQNLVLHRDLKPSNVLVTGEGTVKLLDFGIAKLLNPTLADAGELPVTRTAFRPMTPAYASPEQLRGDPLTTASDVYSLGLLLYELLTGTQAHRISADATPAALAAMVEREPERASARAARDPAAAEAHDTTPERLARTLRGDLDAIVAMALRREPGRRYGSAELLAEDVGRHLDGRTVLAHRGSGWYRFEKLLRRHRAAAAFAAASVLLLVGGIVVALRLASDAARERDRASHALSETQRSLGESEAVTAFLVGLFEASNPAEGRSDTLTAADLLRRGGARAERLGGQPLAQARMLEALGRVHASRGDLALGAELLGRALALRRVHAGPDNPATATTGAHLAEVLRRQGRYATADTLAREALRARRRALGDAHPDVATSLQQLNGLAIYRGDLASAEAFAREAIAVRRRAGRGDDSAMVRDLERFGDILWRRGDRAGAERALREALASARTAFPGPHPFRAFVLLRLADRLEERPGGEHEAEALFRAALAEARAALGDAHPETAEAMKQLGAMLARHGRAAEGEPLVREALAIQRRARGPSSTVVADNMLALALLLGHGGWSAEAERLCTDAVAIYAASLGTAHPGYAHTLGYLADVLAQRGALDSAESVLRRVHEIDLAAFGPRHNNTAQAAAQLGDVRTRQRRFREADSLYRGALVALRRQTTDGHPDVRRLYAGMARMFEAMGRADSAARYRRLAGP